MPAFSLRNLVVSSLLCVTCLTSVSSFAGGIVLGGTRIIYPAGQKQTSITVRNTSSDSRYMVQSWIEDATEKKSSDFILTPPLYVSNPGSENALRIMYAGPKLPEDRESLYYLTANAIPSVDKSKTEGKNVLLLAAATRIKVFVRPAGLMPEVNDAPALLTFKKESSQVKVSNPTPYYITIVDLKAGGKDLKSLMVSPMGTATFDLPSSNVRDLSFSTMNDYGGLTKAQTRKL